MSLHCSLGVNGEMLIHSSHLSSHPTHCLPVPTLLAIMCALPWGQINLEPELDRVMVISWVAAEAEQLKVEEGNKGSS